MHALSSSPLLPLFHLQQLCWAFWSPLPLGGAMHWTGMLFYLINLFIDTGLDVSCLLLLSCVLLGGWLLCIWAAQLPVLLYVRFFGNSSLHLCVLHVSILHQGSDGWSTWNSLESNEGISSVCHTNGILFHFSVVCRWADWVSPVPHWNKPGLLTSPGCCMMI